MWILESSSELFQGRRMWLKSGKSYLFGRVKKDGVRFAIEHKTISRKHFIIKVDDVTIEDVGNIHARTKVTIEDQNSKAGTNVNGDLVKGSSKELSKAENYIKPGSLPEDLVLRWQPCVLTFNLLKKELKSGVLKSKQERVKDLDIKAVSEYVASQTTYLVVNKRNTPKSLQALIDGRPLITESYIDALEYAATPSDLNEEENLSPLEQDFDSAWPNPDDYLPPPGRELTKRPTESYQPDPNRNTVFDGFTFVFVDQTQYDNLLPPITTGHGKALLCKIAVGETTTEELLAFLINAAGYKRLGSTTKEQGRGGVILVRYKGDSGAEDWTTNLINETSLKLDQRAIDQGEFLDAVLANDARLLRQAIPFESNGDAAVGRSGAAEVSPTPLSQQAKAQSTVTEPQVDKRNGSLPTPASKPIVQTGTNTNGHNDDSQQGSSSPQTSIAKRQQSNTEDDYANRPKRPRFMVPMKSRVIGFDDDFDPNEVLPYQEDEDDSVAHISDAESEANSAKEEAVSSRKRPRSPDRETSVNFSDEMEDLLPAAAAMKRRKLARGGIVAFSNNDNKGRLIAGPSKKIKMEMKLDVRKLAMAHRKAEEEKLKQERGDSDEELRIDPGQKLPVYDVETVFVDLPASKQLGSGTVHAEGDRWDPKWNGRKNFKGFRRSRDIINGDAGSEPRRRNHTKIIVPMVDAKTSTYGMGDQYWDKTEAEKEREREKKKRVSQKTTQSQSDQSRVSNRRRSLTIDSSDDSDASPADRSVLRTSPELSRLQNEAEDIMHHAIDVDEPRRTRAADTQAQTQITTASSKGARRTTNGTSQGSATKRQMQLPVTETHVDDGDDSDDMKFKFGSRRRGKGRA